jgi:hypothetical protein
MIDRIFEACVALLVFGAHLPGITYKEINVWIFVIIWPILTIFLIVIIVVQHLKIGRLLKKG